MTYIDMEIAHLKKVLFMYVSCILSVSFVHHLCTIIILLLDLINRVLKIKM